MNKTVKILALAGSGVSSACGSPPPTPTPFTLPREASPVYIVTVPQPLAPAHGELVSRQGLTLSWQSLAEVRAYRVQLWEEGKPTPRLVNELLEGTNYSVTIPLTAETGYAWRVRAKGPYGWSAWCKIWRFRVEE